MPARKMTDQGHQQLQQWRLRASEPPVHDDLDTVIWGGERHVPLLPGY